MELEALQALENLRQRLLDLTTRNRLINFRHTRKGYGYLRVIDELPDQLVEMLLDETEMRFEPVPEPNREQLLDEGYIGVDEITGQEDQKKEHPTPEEWARRCGLNTSYEVPVPQTATTNDRHKDTAIQTLLYPDELEARLKRLRQTSESAIQEMGANILYVAFGFLEWFETDGGEPRLAPLFLVPVRLQKGRLNRQTKAYEYRINYSGEDIIPNLSLREKLRQDFGMALPSMDEDTKPETYFEEILELIEENQPTWQLRRYITLTLLNFSKLLMYLDLDPVRWPEGANITDHKIIAQFLGGRDPVQGENDGLNGHLGFDEEYLVDEIEEIHKKYPLIDDADSSQHSALIDAIEGKNLVIEGPPGTGKSQTITNLIAAAMAHGQRVLFVAEKQAALEVVRRRLDAAGLGEFCLELHSHKSQKHKMLDDVRSRLDKHGNYRDPTEIEIEIARYEELKTILNNHAERINRPWKNTGKTLHEIFTAATHYREVIGQNPTPLRAEGYNGGNLDEATRRRTEDMLKIFCGAYQGITELIDHGSDLQQHPWYGVGNIELQIFDLQRVQSTLGDWQHSLQKLNDEREYLAGGLACGQNEIAASLKGLLSLSVDLEHLPVPEGNELLDLLPVLRGQSLDDAQRYLSLFEKIQTHYSTLSPGVEAKVLDDLSEVTKIIAGSEYLILHVNPGITLNKVADAINQLEIMSNLLAHLREPLESISTVMGEELSQRLSLTKVGLVEFRTFIELTASLEPPYWECRDELFDNDELDDILPRLQDELMQLHILQDELSEVFRLYALPVKDELRSIRETLDAGRGIFRWFDSRWRKARNRVLNLAAGYRGQFSQLYPLLQKAEDFSKKRQALEENKHYQQALGKHLEGLKTDMVLLNSLRTWYKSVRHEYGVGFGSRVALGSAILDMPRDTIRAIRSLFEQDITQKISDFLENLESVKTEFNPVSELNDNKKPLAGDDGVISTLLRSSKKALLACEPLLLTNNAISIEELRHYKTLLVSFKQTVNDWHVDDCGDRLFQGRLGLELGANADNTSALSRLRNTLKIADCIAALDNENVRRRIYAQPEVATLNTIESLSSRLRSRMESESTKFGDFVELTKLEPSDWMRESGDQMDKLIARNELALNNIESLQKWVDYVRFRKQLLDKKLDRLVRAVEYGDLDVSLMIDAYNAGIFDTLAREVLREQPELSDFAGLTLNTYQEQFREYDNRLKDLQTKKIAWRISQRKIPSGNFSVRKSELTELHLLKHQCSLQRTRLSIRQLLLRAGNALAALKPCFMMGPMSLAQYLEPGRIEFDLIIMDEASQIKPEEALGAIARGKQAVVVGDPKQLPPTSFFDRIVIEDGEDTMITEEAESILDATLPMPMFSARRLRWHYRSQHESLIAFSNHSFYDSDLVLFPSPHKKAEGYGVRYTRVPRGCFNNGRNMEEARIISEAVRKHFSQQSEETLGVAAMNAEQCLHIESAIESLARDDGEFRKRLEEDSSRQEPLFVKNLENVQGDERDVIFISMTYGPQKAGGRVFQWFGPINSETGWRRLNVLFTRSKKRMHIFSSMGSQDIIIHPKTKRGVKELKKFLAYGETGILPGPEIEPNRSPDSDFEIAVIKALQDKGFECVPQVGVAGFFIDIAVVDPGNQGRYLMGIECDGATYHSAKSARDRDRLRQSILERLGWRIRRIWSTDWFKNPHAELQPILQELNSLKTEMTEEAVQVASESAGIESIVEQDEQQDGVADEFIFEEEGLEEKLIAFDREIIRQELPDTPDNARLLRPAMLKAILEHQPVSGEDFREYIPGYLRQSTNPGEAARYLDQVLAIINASS